MTQVVTKKTNRLLDEKIDKIVNIRAMHRLNKSINRKVLLGNLPKMDDFLDELVENAIEDAGVDGDDVDEVSVAGDEDSSDDDEEFDVVAEDEDALYEVGGVLTTNDNLEAALMESL